MHTPRVLVVTTWLCYFLMLTKSIGMYINLRTSGDLLAIIWLILGIGVSLFVVGAISQRKEYGRKVCLSFTFFALLSWLVHIQTIEHRYLVSFVPLQFAGAVEYLVLALFVAYIVIMFRSNDTKTFFAREV